MRHKNYILILLLSLLAFAASAQVCPGPAQRQALINLQKSGILNGTRAYQIPMTDTCGNQRYVTIDSIITIVVDSIGSDTALQENWYTDDGTTTDPLRTATVDSAAQWLGDNADGFFYFQMGTLAGGRAYVDTDESSIFFGDLGGVNTVEANTTGIDITTSATASRAVDLTTDTVNMIASFDPTLMTVNLLSDGTYFAADSLKVVGIGQFPDFPSINFDGRDKGFFYKTPFNVTILNGDGGDGSSASTEYTPTGIEQNIVSDFTPFGIIQTTLNASTTDLNEDHFFTLDGSTHAQTRFSIEVTNVDNIVSFWHVQKDTNVSAIMYFGESDNSPLYDGRRAFGLRTTSEEQFNFDWIQTYLPNDTSENAVSFYNRAYYWKNEHPTGAAGDTLFHFWAATGAGGEAGSDPGFMTLDSIRGPGGGDNWYTADGTTTDAHRIATVSGKATWTSADTTGDGNVPYRFIIDGGVENEPEALVIKFTNPEEDSLLFHKSDQEIFITSDAPLVVFSREILTFQADSIVIENSSAEEVTTVRMIYGGTAGNSTVKKVDADDASAGQALISNGTDWVVSDISDFSLVNWTESFSSATEATSAFTATNAGSNVNAAIIPKGTGAFLLDMPDGASTGGNARGTSAVDLQIGRSAAAQVASGDYSALLGGRRNIASGAGAFCIGGTTGFAVGSVASGTNSGTIGNSDTASAVSSYAIGQTSTASGNYSTAIGLQANASHYGQNAFSSADAGVLGGSQNSTMRVYRSITGTAQTEIFLDGSTATQRMTLVGNQFWNATIQVIAVTSTAGAGTGTLGDTYVATYTVGIKRLGSTTSLVGAVQTMSAAQADAGINDAVFTIDADDTNEALRIRFTPPTSAAGNTVTEAFATIYLSEIRY